MEYYRVHGAIEISERLTEQLEGVVPAVSVDCGYEYPFKGILGSGSDNHVVTAG